MEHQKEENSLCELMYKMRDAVLAHKLHIALFISRQIHDKISVMILEKQDVDCILECELPIISSN